MNANDSGSYSNPPKPAANSGPLQATHRQWITALDSADREECTRSYHLFSKRAFRRVVDKSRPFQDAWFYPVMGEYAQALVCQQIRRLICITPPGCYKSGFWSVGLPAWTWLTQPWHRFLIANNERTLVTELSNKGRDIVKSEWYQHTFMPTWALRDDQDTKQYYENTEGGARRGVSTGSIVGGKKGHTVIVDDLHDAFTVHSDVVRQSDKSWARETLFDRIIDFATGGIAIIGHRTHPDDIQSEYLHDPEWEVLHLPERFEERLRKTFCVRLPGLKVHTDPRQEGEYLRPDRFGTKQEEEVKKVSGIVAWDTKHQGVARAREGSLFPREKWRIVPVAPVGTEAIRFWDTAARTTPGASATASVLIGRTPDKRYIVLDRIAKRMVPKDRNELMLSVARLDRRIPGVTVIATWIEHPGGSGGVEAGENMVSMLAGFNVLIQTTSGSGSKEFRAGPFSAQQAAGNVDLLEADWNKAYIDRMEAAHMSSEKDDMDASSGAFIKLTKGGEGGDVLPGPDPLQGFAPGTFGRAKPTPLDAHVGKIMDGRFMAPPSAVNDYLKGK